MEGGRLLRVTPNGYQLALVTGLDAPEAVVWSPDESLYLTESNVQFVEQVPWGVVTRVTRVWPDGIVTDVVTDTVLWSYSALAIDAEGVLYVANEASNVATTDSIFRVDPVTQTRTLFASGLTSPEGLAFSAGGSFPLYATEEDVGGGHGRLSRVDASGATTPLCTGFARIQAVAVDKAGNLYVDEDEKGQIVQITAPDLEPPAPPRQLAVTPPSWTASNAFTLTWTLPADPSGIAGAYVKLGSPPAFITDGTFYAGAEPKVTGLTLPGPGAFSAHLWLQDGLGNLDPESAATATLSYDPDPPSSPSQLSSEPAGWSMTDNFTLTWENPVEVSGVVTACYRLDGPPADADDFEGCQAGADIGTLGGISLGESLRAAGGGERAAYLWLADAAGNVDPATAVSTNLRYDVVPPVSTASSPITTLVAPIRVSWLTTDNHSGVERVSLWVRMGGSSGWADSGLSSPAEGAGFFLYQPAGEGTYYFATRATDQAGNAEGEPAGDGDAQTVCQTWQRAYLPLRWKPGP